MTNYRSSHAPTKHHHAGESAILPPRHKSTGAPTEGAKEKESPPAFLAWPFYLYDRMFNPQRNITSVVEWMDSWRVGSRILIPKSQSRESETAYHYLIELPDVARDQIVLNFKNGVIMLRVEGAEEERGRSRYYRHSHSIRRAFSLPVYTDAGAITAELKDSILNITIPKTDKPVSPKSRTIEIT